MQKPLRLSRSKLDAFLACPKCFWLDMHGKGAPAAFPMGLYNIFDSFQKKYYDKHRNQGLPPMLKDKLPVKLADIRLVERFRKGIGFEDKDINAILWGKLDDCFIDSKNRLVVMDNKTSSSGNSGDYEEGYKFQLDTYGYILERNDFDVAPFGYLVYFIPDRESEFEKGVKFTVKPKRFDLDTDRVYDVFRGAVETARRETSPKSHEDCEMCLWLVEMEGLNED